MQLSKERIGALFFLALAILYGYYGSEIQLFPGDEMEAMNARTLPYAITILTVALAIFLLATANPDSEDDAHQVFEWKLVVLLIGLTVLYGLALDWLGFLLATILFLICGIRILGETRWRVLLKISFSFVVIFWGGLTQGLDIYLAPGRLFAGLFSG